MANEMFTNRKGEQVPVPALVVPPVVVLQLMIMREAAQAKGERCSLSGILLDLIATGKTTLERRVKTAAKNKDNRDTGKNVKEYIRIQLALRKPIDPKVIAELAGAQLPEEIDGETEGDISDLSVEELDAATAPDAVVS